LISSYQKRPLNGSLIGSALMRRLLFAGRLGDDPAADKTHRGSQY
jgi:hypothetical protein